jgi:hypothetical protein
VKYSEIGVYSLIILWFAIIDFFVGGVPAKVVLFIIGISIILILLKKYLNLASLGIFIVLGLIANGIHKPDSIYFAYGGIDLTDMIFFILLAIFGFKVSKGSMLNKRI